MAVLGKDIFDLYRPHTHTKIQFGDKGYWVEWGTDCLPYGSILTEILNCSITDYCAKLSAVEQAVAACDPEHRIVVVELPQMVNGHEEGACFSAALSAVYPGAKRH